MYFLSSQLGGLHTEELKKEVEAGRAFATQEYADGTCYSSRIICKENKVYLHALKNEPTPRAAFTLQVGGVLYLCVPPICMSHFTVHCYHGRPFTHSIS